MADTIEGALARRAARQSGLFTTEQARQAGMSDDQLDRRVARGLYERVGTGVFAVAGVAWTWERHARAALLGVGPLARRSPRTAAHFLGFEGLGECPIEVTVPKGRRARTDLATVHTTTHLHPLDGIERRGFP